MHADENGQILAAYPLSAIERTNRLLADYLSGAFPVGEFFAHAPDDIIALAREVRAPSDRAAVAAVLGDFQRELGAAQPAVDAAAALADPTTPVITVGQQPGLLTGACYTIYKTLTAIALARRVSAELGRPVVPVFWAATDDDDRGEVDHCAWWDQHEAWQAIHYPDDAGLPGQLVGDLPAGEAGRQVLATALPLLAGLPHAEEVETLLRETLADSADLGYWFCRVMARLFSPLGLVVCDPRLPSLRRLSTEVLARELAAPLQTTVLVNAQAKALQQRGYRPALLKPPDSGNFFLTDTRRHRVTFDGERFHADERDYAPAALRAVLTHPDSTPRLLPNAVLRPVVQEYLFGSAACVVGPNELGYWAELRPVFQALGVAMPAVIPRAAVTLVPPAAARTLREWQLDPLDLLIDPDGVRFGLLERALPSALNAQFADGRAHLARMTAALTETLAQLDATLPASALAMQQRMENEFERLERKTLKAVERRSGELTGRLSRVQSVLFPQHAPQERALNIFPLLARHGLPLLERLLVLLEKKEGQHLFVELC